MKVAVLGAGGIIAPAIVRDLAESEEASELLLLDLDADRAQAVADTHGGAKSQAAAVDARSAWRRRSTACDVLVNSASYRVNLDAMRACLEAGCHYVDLGGLYWLTGEQIELSPRFEAAGLHGDPRHGLLARQDQRDGGARPSRSWAPRPSGSR